MRAEILKFGGTSVGGYEAFQQSCNVVELHRRKGIGLVVVVSAMAKVTDKLDKAYESVLVRNLDGSMDIIDKLEEQHLSVLGSMEERLRIEVEQKIGGEMDRVRNDLDAVYRLRAKGNQGRDLIRSAGERTSSFIFGAFLHQKKIPTVVLEAGEVIKTDSEFGDALPDPKLTAEMVKKIITPELEKGNVVVIGGFYGTNLEGETTTLGRGGSDLTATTMGSMLNDLGYEVLGVNLYKADVGGVMTTDPGDVSTAYQISHLTRGEGGAATMLGAKVIHPRAISALRQGIPINVKGTLAPENPGTIIDDKYILDEHPAKMIVRFDSRLISLTGSAMDKPGISEIIYRSLAQRKINTRSSIQPPTEGVVNVLIPSDAEVDQVIKDLGQSFVFSIESGDIRTVSAEKVSAVGIVGEGINPGVVEKVYGALSREGGEIFNNGYRNGSGQGRVIYIGPSDRQFSMFLRGDENGEEAVRVVRILHKVLFEG